jgi:hypothetical protein
MNPALVAVVTTVQAPTACMRRLAEVLRAEGRPLIVVGDRKGPAGYDLPGAEFYPLAEQLRLPFRLAAALPVGHYARKNLGYLIAIARGAGCVYETDDDNMPNDRWQVRRLHTPAERVEPRPWLNVYRLFCDEPIWPRGFPLDRVLDPGTYRHTPSACAVVEAPIQQGLADLAPDVDAVWRLVIGREVFFGRRPSVWLPPGTWCPFNSQTVWWWPAVYPLLYLPSYCSFRMTDIWRSFVAQRCLWELGLGVVFHEAEVVQQRNEHGLMRDFTDEIPGYQRNGDLVRCLDGLRLEPGPTAVGTNLARCYRALAAGGFFPADELSLVDSWLDDVGQAVHGRAAA